jgi:outer membrane protein assembly factor BamB
MDSPHRQGEVIRTALLALGVAFLCIGLAIWLVHRRSVAPPAQAPIKPVPRLAIHAVGTDWPMFGGGPAHLGRASGTLADKLELAWTYKTSGPIKSSPAILEDRVYVGSSDANVCALDLRTGSRIWSYKAGDSVEAPVCVKEGVVYVGATDGWLYALDAKDGSLRWKYQTGGQIAGGANWVESPQGDRVWIVVGSHDGSVHCVDSRTGQSVWTYKTDNYVNGLPAVAEGRCVIGGCDARVHVISVADGNGVTTIDSGSYIAASPAIFEGQVYIGNYDGVFLKADIGKGEVLWRHPVPDAPILTSPALVDQVVVFGARDKQVHCLRQQDGQTVWTFKALDNVDSSPLICDGKVMFGSDDGRLYMVRVIDGSLVWSYLIGKPITSSPAVAFGVVVVGCDDGSVYAFGEMR